MQIFKCIFLCTKILTHKFPFSSKVALGRIAKYVKKNKKKTKIYVCVK